MISREEFEREFARLISAADGAVDNAGCVACTDCERCVESTFCSRSRGLLRCHYCVDSERLSASTHCRGCVDLHGCTHCESSERCSQSSYLVRCVDCTNCTYCFGCVGLTGKDFHILNKPYPRSEYFAIVGKLAAQVSSSVAGRSRVTSSASARAR